MRNKKNILFGLSLCLAFGLASCSDDNCSAPFIQPDLEITNAKGVDKVAADKELQLKAKIKGNTKGSNFYWTVNGDKVADDLVNYEDSTFNFIQDAAGKYAVGLVFEYEGLTYPTSKEITVLKSFAKGTLVLNENGGKLIHISPEGDVSPDAYFEVNNRRLGSVCQDLFIKGDKLYIIAQNGSKEKDTEGKLLIANASTLERIDSYQNELGNSWSTHISVLDDENILINIGGSISRFSLSSKKMIPIEGTSGAAKTRMAVVGGKAYVVVSKSIVEIEANTDKVSRVLNLDKEAQSVIASHDGNLWVAIGSNQIAHVDVNSFAITESKTITEGNVSRGSAATPSISAYKGEIYYSGTQFTIYMLNFLTGENKKVADLKAHTDDTVVYQTVQVNPANGDTYMTTIKDWGDSGSNNINVFTHEPMKLTFLKQYKDLLAYPAGVYFPENYN